jgi:hypothetical protein
MSALSEYELARSRTIAANEAKLKELGLLDVKLIPKNAKPPPKRKRVEEDPEYKPERRTTRVSGASKRSPAKASQSDDESSGDSESDEPLSRRGPRAAPRAAPRERVTAVPRDDGVVKADADPEGAILVEKAKTGRAKCRGCMELIEEGAERVGMKSWMVGRAVTVWQHPACFWSQLKFTEEPTGRSRCKQTKESFEQGEKRLSATAHTTTSHFKLDAAADLLRPLISMTPSCKPSAIEGEEHWPPRVCPGTFRLVLSSWQRQCAQRCQARSTLISAGSRTAHRASSYCAMPPVLRARAGCGTEWPSLQNREPKAGNHHRSPSPPAASCSCGRLLPRQLQAPRHLDGVHWRRRRKGADACMQLDSGGRVSHRG